MKKELDFNKTVAELVEEFPEFQQAMAEKQARHDAIASCEYCDDRGLATTQDAAGNDVLIRCPHSGPLPIIPAPEPVVHNPPPPEVRAWFDRQHSTKQPALTG